MSKKAVKPAAAKAAAKKPAVKATRSGGKVVKVKPESMANVPTIDIGIASDQREKIAAGLSRLLADEYTLYLKTHNYHWNVTGPMFNTLHLMFEGQYTALALAVDLIAERIRALGVYAPGSYAQFSTLTSISEETGVPDATTMIKNLLLAREACARTARSVIAVSQGADDEPTSDLLTQRLQDHEKTAWMLRSLLQ